MQTIEQNVLVIFAIIVLTALGIALYKLKKKDGH